MPAKKSHSWCVGGGLNPTWRPVARAKRPELIANEGFGYEMVYEDGAAETLNGSARPSRFIASEPRQVAPPVPKEILWLPVGEMAVILNSV